MDFDLTGEQAQLRDALRRYLAEAYPFAAHDAASRHGAGWRPEVWRALATELGLLGAALPEGLGGQGGGGVEVMLIAGELGAALALEPYVETVVTCGGLLREVGGAVAHDLLRRIIAGEAVAAFGWAEPTARHAFADAATTAVRDGDGWRLNGMKALVTAAPWADRLIVTARTGGAPGDDEGLSLFLLDPGRPGVTLKPYPTIDGRRAADVLLDDARLGAEALLGVAGRALPMVEKVADEAVAALSAEAVGVLRRMLRDTVVHTGRRRQFGKTLSEMQALQHRMVDMFMHVEAAHSAVLLATLSLDAPAPRRARAVSAAKATVGRACRFVGQNAIQLHGGMGMTDELPLGRYFKRAMAIDAEFGGEDHHLQRYGALAEA
ncbi:MAG: acyl-CoA dehydrogenase family protein [Bordetella sp.]|nr:acyl-CoA dehydrogenase family protein [Bordetella sp.]